MDEARLFNNKMTGAEIKKATGNSEILFLEKAHRELETQLFTVEEQLKKSWEEEWSEELPERQETWEKEAAELREQIRKSMDALRTAQEKFPTLTGSYRVT
jgi:predicted  nucleic acid-binding Zn-ribbon protein